MTDRESIYIKNKYTKIYFQIIEKAKVSPYIGYTEKHHIIPRSLGGSDDKSNLVKLTARQHYICHLLLTKMVEPNSDAYHKMIKAYMMMAWCKDHKDEPYKVNSRLFESLRIKYCELQTIRNKPLDDLIMERSTYNGDCLLWNKSVTTYGLPQYLYDGKNVQVHKYMYEKHNNVILEKGYVVKQTCSNTRCINPNHLVLKSLSEHYADNKESYNKVNNAKSKDWIINGITYKSIRSASKSTGISQSTICKYTKNGIFDINDYHEGCKKTNMIPKV